MNESNKIVEIQQSMELGRATPHQLSEWRIIVVGMIGRYTTQLQEIQLQKPPVWQALRKDYKSNADTERAWQATELGLQESWLDLEIKKLDKMSSALRTAIEVATQEARGNL